MSVMEKLKDAIGLDGDNGVTTYRYDCHDCDAEFESAKRPERAACPECVSEDVEVVEET
ncbi:MAG: Zn finger protein HypA/HybF involved in hydrogenase expression [Haloarculaceae archaeon]|jgi:Zn finger protein HypA/HybF involved in hydrogenase expression